MNKPVIRRRSVSVATIDGLHACYMQQKRFRNTFGVGRRNRIEITAENLLLAQRGGLHIYWLVYKVLSHKWIASYITRRRNIQTKYLRGELTWDEREAKIAEVLAKILREHWGEK